MADAQFELYDSAQQGRPTLSNTRHTNGRPVGTPVPPSADVAEATVADVIGQAVALHLGQMLGQLLPRMPWRPDCYFCVAAARTVVRDYQIRVELAAKGGEPNPEPPAAPEVAQSVTLVPVTQMAAGPAGPVPVCVAVPACFAHVSVQADAPKPTGLVAPDGRPIIRGPVTSGQPRSTP